MREKANHEKNHGKRMEVERNDTRQESGKKSQKPGSEEGCQKRGKSLTKEGER